MKYFHTLHTLVLFSFLWLTAVAFAQTTVSDSQADKAAPSLDETLRQAKSAYDKKDYMAATALFEKCLKDSISGFMDEHARADINYNLGNCYYRTNHLAQAVIHYQRTLRYNPADEDAAFNLSLVQSKLTDRFDTPAEMFFISWVRQLFLCQNANGWGFWGLAFTVIAFTFILLCLTLHRIWVRKLMLVSAVLTGLLSVLCFASAYHVNNGYHDEKQAVVTAEEMETYSNPTTSSAKLKTLHEGTLLTLTDNQNGEWQEIKLPDGTTAWAILTGKTEGV